MSKQAKSSFTSHTKTGRSQDRSGRSSDAEVHLITGASESVVKDSERKNRTYALLIGVRIVSIFMVLFTEGWVQIAILVGGMLAPWVGVQIANNIRQVSNTSETTVPPQQAALETAHSNQENDAAPEDTVLIGDFVTNDKPSAAAEEESVEDHDDQRS